MQCEAVPTFVAGEQTALRWQRDLLVDLGWRLYGIADDLFLPRHSSLRPLLQKLYDQLTGKVPPRKSLILGLEEDPANWFLVHATKLFVLGIISFCPFFAFPLWMIIDACTGLQLQKMVTGWFLHVRNMSIDA